MRKIVVITPPDARHGFALAGVRQRIAGPEEAPAVLRELALDPQTGLVIVDERLAVGVVPARIRDIERRWPGLIVVLPAPGRVARAAADDYVLRLLRRAIGYQVRLGS